MLAPEAFGTVIIGAVLLFAGPDRDGPPRTPPDPPAAGAEARSKSMRDWISLTGVVRSVSPQRFLLDHGGGEIVVDLQGGPDGGAQLLLRPGDRVTVDGVLDSGFYSRHRLEADAVYLQRLDRYVFAGPPDSDDPFPALPGDDAGGGEGGMAVTGTVAGIHDRRLTLYSGGGSFTVDTSGMAEDPTRRAGAARVDLGDRVAAAGRSGTADEAGAPGLSASRVTVLPPS